MENISLFGKTMCEKSQDKDLFSGGPLDVVRMEFVEAETLRWEDLFSGFDSLRAITYSSAIGFVYQLVDMFEDVEVIFGSEEVLSYSLQEIMAYQCKMVDRMRDTASKMKIDLISRVEDNTLHFFIAREKLSHEKNLSPLIFRREKTRCDGISQYVICSLRWKAEREYLLYRRQQRLRLVPSFLQ